LLLSNGVRDSRRVAAAASRDLDNRQHDEDQRRGHRDDREEPRSPAITGLGLGRHAYVLGVLRTPVLMTLSRRRRGRAFPRTGPHRPLRELRRWLGPGCLVDRCRERCLIDPCPPGNVVFETAGLVLRCLSEGLRGDSCRLGSEPPPTPGGQVDVCWSAVGPLDLEVVIGFPGRQPFGWIISRRSRRLVFCQKLDGFVPGRRARTDG
jgi:hypothetical protein